MEIKCIYPFILNTFIIIYLCLDTHGTAFLMLKEATLKRRTKCQIEAAKYEAAEVKRIQQKTLEMFESQKDVIEDLKISILMTKTENESCKQALIKHNIALPQVDGNLVEAQ